MIYTILIKNGIIIDGTGSKPYQGDIGILGNIIKDIGPIGTLGDKADTVIDAANLLVTPGFIDITNHSDTYGTLFSVPGQDSLLTQGVTSILMGNCGYSLAPLIKKAAFEDLGRWTNTSTFNIDWSSVGEFYDAVQHIGLGVNVATLVGQETLRKNASSVDEQDLLLERSLQEGAWGLSSNFSFVDLSESMKKETFQLLKTLKKHDGLWKIHMGDEGQNLLPATASALEFAREAGVRTVISHFKAIGRTGWNDFNHALELIRRSREQGAKISFDIFPYLRTGSMLLSFLPAWAREGDNATILARLKDPEQVKFILEELERATLHPERIMIASAKQEKAHVGKTLDEISQNIGLSPEKAILEILKTNNLAVTIFGKTLHSKNIIDGVKHKHAIIASDGAGYDLSFLSSKDLAHPRSFGAFSRFFHNIGPTANLPMETVVQKMTHAPAQAMGITNRGVIAKNLIADVAVFDPEQFQDHASYSSPYRYSTGMHAVIVNGHVVVSDDAVGAQRCGNALMRA